MIRTITFILVLVVLGYGGLKGYPLLRGPLISLAVEPQNADPYSEPDFTTISGTAVHTETLLLNGSTLLIDKDGHFEKRLTLPRGGAILSLTATDRFGKSRSIERTVITP
jgi:Glucodextranase, domain B